jgi:hypothetical protein
VGLDGPRALLARGAAAGVPRVQDDARAGSLPRRGGDRAGGGQGHGARQAGRGHGDVVLARNQGPNGLRAAELLVPARAERRRAPHRLGVRARRGQEGEPQAGGADARVQRGRAPGAHPGAAGRHLPGERHGPGRALPERARRQVALAQRPQAQGGLRRRGAAALPAPARRGDARHRQVDARPQPGPGTAVRLLARDYSCSAFSFFYLLNRSLLYLCSPPTRTRRTP